MGGLRSDRPGEILNEHNQGRQAIIVCANKQEKETEITSAFNKGGTTRISSMPVLHSLCFYGI